MTDELNRTSRIWTVSASWVPDDTHVIRAATREAELTIVIQVEEGREKEGAWGLD